VTFVATTCCNRWATENFCIAAFVPKRERPAGQANLTPKLREKWDSFFKTPNELGRLGHPGRACESLAVPTSTGRSLTQTGCARFRGGWPNAPAKPSEDLSSVLVACARGAPHATSRRSRNRSTRADQQRFLFPAIARPFGNDATSTCHNSPSPPSRTAGQG
jgi:hypothetical protein